MKKRLLFLVAASLFSISTLWAQNVQVSGKIIEGGTSGNPAIGAVIQMNPTDSEGLSSPSRTVASGVDGKFTIKTNKPSSTIKISYMGFKDRYITIEDGNPTVDLGTITLTVDAAMAEEAVITAQATMGQIKGDTTQFNAAAFKTDPDATSAALIAKMPGVTTDDDGNLEVEGEKIAKVLVNGKEYFDDDPALALQNLPVDAVESVQFFDDQTDDAKFSGYDTGERVKTVNIVTKRNVMDNMIGKAFAGVGTDGRYGAGAGGNWMTDNTRLALTAQLNNTNNQGFSMNDITGSSGYGRGRGMRGGSGVDLGPFSTNVNSGIRDTKALGVNYSGDYNDNLKLSASYFFNQTDNEQISTIAQDFLTNPRYYTEYATINGTQYDHRFSSKIEWMPNETNRITFSPRVNYTTNSGITYENSQTLEGYGGALLNSAVSDYDRALTSYNVSSDLWWQHRFGKAGRVLSMGGIVSGQKSWGEMEQWSDYLSEDPTTLLVVPDSIRQLGYVDMSRYALTGSATYTEPISERSRLSLNYSINYDRTISDRQGWNQLEYDAAMQTFALMELDTLTTNYMNRNTTTNTVGLTYGYNIGNEFTLSASLRYQYAELNSLQEFPVITPPGSGYDFSAFMPMFNLRYNPSKSTVLEFRYNTNSIFPTVTQLQDILDVSNILQVSRGNSALEQSYNHNMRLTYRYNNMQKNIFFMVGGRASIIADYIANHRQFLTSPMEVDGTVIPSGAQLIEPVNLDGYFNGNIFTNLTLGVNPLKSKLSIMGFYNYAKTPSIENNVEYMSTSNRIGTRFQLASNIEGVDFNVGYSPSINLSNAGTGAFDRYWSHTVSANISWNLWKGFYLRADGQWRNTYGTQESYDQHYGLLNASLTQKFANNTFEITLSGYDLLNQNTAIRQSTNDTYTQTMSTLVMPRYFMATLTWRIDTRKNKSKQNENEDGRPSGGSFDGPPSGGRGSGMGGGGGRMF